MGYFDNIPTNKKQVSATSTKKTGGYFSDIPLSKAKANKSVNVKEIGKDLLKGAIKTPARLATNLVQGLQTSKNIYDILKGKEITPKAPVQPFSNKFLGEVTPIGGGKNLVGDGNKVNIDAFNESVGAGVEMTSFLPFGRVIGAGAKLLKTPISTIAKEGAIGGFFGSVGSEIQNNAQTGEKISPTNIAVGTAGGAILGPALNILGKGAGSLLRKNVPEQAIVPKPNVVPEQDLISTIVQKGQNAPEIRQAVQATPKPVVNETFVPSVSQRLEAEAIERGIVDKYSNLPEVRGMNMKDQAERAVKLTSDDYETAKRVALGEINAEGDLRSMPVFEAVKKRAVEEGDWELQRRLATESTIPTQISEAAQTVKSADVRLIDSNDPVELMQTLVKAREKGSEVKFNGVKRQDVTALRENIKKTVPKVQDWDEFITSIEC